MSTVKIAIALGAVLMMFAAVGSMDYADAQAEADHYAEMVCAGYWPDYDNLKPECEK